MNDVAETGCGIMLNTDFEMFFDLTLDTNFESTCQPRNCNQAATYATADFYATVTNFANVSFSTGLYEWQFQDNAAWISDYVAIFEKMIARGYASTDLSPLE